jgi:hypothetical protein
MGLKFEMQKVGLEIKWPNLKTISRISKIEHVIKFEYICLFSFVVMIEVMASIKVMENDGWFKHNNLRWFCPTQRHPELFFI